jgi:hypothetical protein
MLVRRRLVLAFGAWLLCSSASAAGLDTLDVCAARASPDAKGIVALEAECPGVEAALREAGVVDNLPDGWRNTLNRAALEDLGVLVHPYRDASQAAMDPGALRPILEQLAGEKVKPAGSWWDAVREWLRSWLGKQEAGSSNWLEQLLQRLTGAADLITTVGYVLLALTVIAAIAFVVNELRIAGVLSRRKSGNLPPGTAATLPVAAAPDIAALEAAALPDQPAILLRLLVAHLQANGQLRTDRNLTHRELVTRSQFPDPDSRGRFARVAQLAERMLYGFGEASLTQVNAVLADGRVLLQQLQMSGSARQ